MLGTLGLVAADSVPAAAESTPVSEFTKVGIDQTTPSTATVDSPGAAAPGDTIKWVLSYQNTTGADAAVSIKDPITAGQSYVANSLQLPPNLTGNVSANTLSASGTVLSGSTAGSIPTSTPVSIDFTTPGGDGYSVENYGTNVYTVYHHNNSNTQVFCSTLTNTTCPNWPANTYASYVSPVAGTPIGTGANGTWTALQNGSFIVAGKLYWGAALTTAVSGKYSIGVMCLDLTTVRATSCGYTELDTVSGFSGSAPLSTNGVAASDGNFYFFDSNGNMLCFSASTGSCGKVGVSGGLFSNNSNASMLTSGRYVYTTFVSGTTLYLTCYDVSAHAVCGSAYPINEGAPNGNAGYANTIAPVLDRATGALRAACDLGKGACYAPDGTALASNPYSGISGIGYPPSTVGFGDGAIVGTKFYASPRNDVITCWDFALWSGSGAVPKCAGFTGPTNTSNYTVRPLTGDLEGCGVADGDAGQIKIFNLSGGGGCNAVTAVNVSVAPSTFYCDGRSGHVSSWSAVSLVGLSASDFSSARLTLTDANGANVPGWVDVSFPPSGPQSIDISSIPTTGPTASLTAHVTIVGAKNPSAMSSAQVKITWSGDPLQVCYETKVAAVPCLTSSSVSNTATAVTTAGNVSDGPAGNSTGTVRFTVKNAPAACLLHLQKSASPNPARPGNTVTYTITVTNTGTSAYAAGSPASFSDDITSSLRDSSYNAGSVAASAGTASYDASTRVISWSGPLAAGASATVTYTVTVNDPDSGPHSMVNRVVTPVDVPSNCAAGSTDPACVATVPIQSFRVVKQTTATVIVPGQSVPYTITVTNTGGVDYSASAPASFTDDLSGVLDDATYNADAAATAGSVSYAAPVLSWSGPLAVGASVTVHYSVTVNTPDNGDKQLRNRVETPTDSGGNCATGSTDPVCHIEVPAKTFAVVKTASSSVTEEGSAVTYTLTVTNTGQVDYTTASPASLTDDLTGVLDDATYNADAQASAGTVAYTRPALTWSGPLAVGAVVTITYTVTVQAPDTGDHMLTNVVMNPPESGGSCVPGNTDPACRNEVPVRAYTVAKSSPSAGSVYPGQTVPYTITVTNTGGVAYTATDPAMLSDDLSGVIDDATYQGDAAASSGMVSYTAPVLSWSGALGLGERVTITYTVKVNDPPTGDGTLTNAAVPNSEGGRCWNHTPGPCAPVVRQIARYTVTKTSSATNVVHPGDTISYTITVHNPSNGDFTVANPAGFTDDLAAVEDDATYNGDAAASAGALAYQSPTLSWTGALAAGSTATVTYSVTVLDPDTGDGILSNAATPKTPGGYCADGSAGPCAPVVRDVQSFHVVKTASPSGPVHPGETVSYTIAVHNTGQVPYSAQQPASFIDDLSKVLDDAAYNADATATAGSVSYRKPVLTWSGPLDVGATVTITYTVTVANPDGGDLHLINPVVTPPGIGGNCPAGSTDAACSVTLDVYSLLVAKKADTTLAAAGQKVTYTITVTNTGHAAYTAADPAAFTDDLGKVVTGATYNSDAKATTGTLAYQAPKLSWSGPLAVGATATVTYSVTVDQSVSMGQTLRNAVVTTTDGNCAAGSTDPDCEATVIGIVIPPSILAVTGADARMPAIVGGLLLATGLLLLTIRRWRRNTR
ncbi:hypothetical protein [Microbacterium candidum]|uniref:DUF7927 domain-containing protein n=1 Tax=Microbacterium candidum TaxID=3041922 RepID=A0ABT7MTM8_9MICO|nr:hypothetical protein [Microbacterium sp. ASV49]MDL9977805.1 hypothetical protein [Microbacterium sp. ASV49]